MHVVGTAGHVDHGKSALVHALTGIDPDRFAEEKRRGLTIDLGFAWFTLPSGQEVGIVDVPGHERFIRNMLAGAGAIDIVVFVVAADEGWKPQSEEHLQILDLLGIAGGVVALTKSDLVDEPALERTRDAVWQRLRSTCLHDAQIVAVSATTRTGLDGLVSAVDDVLTEAGDPSDHGRPRMFVDRSFTISGAGTIVTGTLAGGRLRVGDEVEVQPSGDRARIRSLQTHKRSLDEAAPGSRVAVNLVGLERRDVERGDAIVEPNTWRPTDRFAASLVPLSTLAHPFTERGAFQLYVGSAEVSCRLRFLEDTSEAITAVNVDGNLLTGIRPGYSVLAEVFADRALPIAVGDRFVLRDAGRRETVAGGSVLDIAPPKIRRGDASEIARLHARTGLVGSELADRIVTERGVISSDELLALSGTRLSSNGFEVDDNYASDVAGRATALVERHHTEHPLEVGMPREALRSALGLDTGAFDHLLPGWSDLAVEKTFVRSRKRADDLGPDDRARADEALARLRAGGTSPPLLNDVGLPMALAKALERRGELVLLPGGIAYPMDAWTEIREQVVAFISDHGPAPASALRDAISTSRKYAIPILERLDADRITRRKGDLRELV